MAGTEDDYLLPQAHEAAAPPRDMRKVVAVAALVGALGFTAAGAVAGAFFEDKKLENLEESSAPSDVQAVYYKRTHASLDSAESGQWASTYLGLELAAVQNYYDGTDVTESTSDTGVRVESFGDATSSGGTCATRSVLLDDLNVAWHEVQSSTSETGPLPPSYWYSYVYGLHADRFPAVEEEASFEWDGFMHAASHYYTSSLTKFLQLYMADGLKFIARRYTSADGATAMFTLHVPMKANGQMVVLHSPTVAEKYERYFLELEASACAEAVALPYDASLLATWFASMETDGTISATNTGALPLLMPVMETAPSVDTDAVVTYFSESLAAVGLSVTSAVGGAGDHACSMANVELKTTLVGPDAGLQGLLTLRYVAAPGGYDASGNSDTAHSVGDFNAYVEAMTTKYMGFNTGYTRWVDNHVGVTLPDGVSLDALAAALEAAQTPYHAHETSYGESESTEGSLWSAGIGGLAIEWHGRFDQSYFPADVGPFDFCQADSTCRGEDAFCSTFDDVESGSVSLLNSMVGPSTQANFVPNDPDRMAPAA